jgi:hypothetical protein
MRIYLWLFSLRLVMKMRLRRNNRKRMNAGPTAELDLNMTYSEACLPHQSTGHDRQGLPPCPPLARAIGVTRQRFLPTS